MFYMEIRAISEISVKKLFWVNCYIVPQNVEMISSVREVACKVGHLDGRFGCFGALVA